MIAIAHVPEESLLTRREVATLAGVSLASVDKAIEQEVVEIRRGRRRQALLDTDALAVMAILKRVGVPLPVRLKRRIRECVRASPNEGVASTEISLTDAVLIRVTPEVAAVARRADEYLERRARYIEANPEIKGSVPVIRGTRLSVYAVEGRSRDGDTIDDLVADYSHIPREAFETALLYARAHPRRGRPSRRPWREA